MYGNKDPVNQVRFVDITARTVTLLGVRIKSYRIQLCQTIGDQTQDLVLGQVLSPLGCVGQSIKERTSYLRVFVVILQGDKKSEFKASLQRRSFSIFVD